MLQALRNEGLKDRLRTWKHLFTMRRAAAALPPGAGVAGSQDQPVKRLVIVPSDPWTLVGAKGDEAMMQSVVGALRARSADLVVAVLVATDRAAEAARGMGFEPLDAWSCPFAEGLRRIDAFGADAMVVLGADVMDGYYSPVTAARMLLTAHAAARRGLRVSLLGFSFNEHPDPRIRKVFDGLDTHVAVNVRDRISLDRFKRFSRATARLVSDSAFMLRPQRSSAVEVVANWADERRAAGDRILGFNVHPMLIRSATPAQVQALVDAAVQSLAGVCAVRPISVLLLSHDYRGNDGDDVCLKPIAAGLAGLENRVAYPTSAFTAAQLKALAGLCDGVVTGRMHLAIAALGMGRPVAALTYQDKFQGLFAHFAYPEQFLLSPAGASDAARLESMIRDFVDQIPALTGIVQAELPKVLVASTRNLDVILGEQWSRPEHAGVSSRVAAAAVFG